MGTRGSKLSSSYESSNSTFAATTQQQPSSTVSTSILPLPLSSPTTISLANINMEGNLKILLLGTGEGGKATIFKQMIHQYGTKRKQDQSLIEMEEGGYMNSYQNLETRRSFIPIIHRNCILAMYNLIQGAIYTFHLPFDMQTNSMTREAIDLIFLERDHAVGYEDWTLNAEAGKMIAHLWNECESIREAYRRRNELELEYMDSAQYWFNEVERLVQVDYVPKIDDIMRMRVKTTGIVETDLLVPIKVRKRSQSQQNIDNNNNLNVGSYTSGGGALLLGGGGMVDAADTREHSSSSFSSSPSLPLSSFISQFHHPLSAEKMLYRQCSLVLVGSQRNERKKWIHAFDDVSAIIFVVSLSEFNQLLYEDGRTNRMQESLLLFSEIANSRRFEGVPIHLFLNKHDIFMEKIQVNDLSCVFPNIPDDLKLEHQPWGDFIPKLIQEKIEMANENLIQHSRSQKILAEELRDYEDQRDAVLSDEELDPLEEMERRKRKKAASGKFKTRFVPAKRNFLSKLLPNKKTTVIKRYSSSILIQRIEQASLASKSSVCSPQEVENPFGLYDEDEEYKLEEETNDTSNEADENYYGNPFSQVSFDVLLYIFMFLEPRDLSMGINMVNLDWHTVSESDILWRSYCLRYQSDLQEETVLKVYEERPIEYESSNENISPCPSYGCSPVEKPSSFITLPTASVAPSSTSPTPRLQLEISPGRNRNIASSKPLRLVDKGPYKHYYQFGDLFVRRNIIYITNQFLNQTSRKDIKTEVTCAVDIQGFKPVMERVIADILREVAKRNKY